MALRLSLLYGSIFLMIGVLLPFWPLWLSARGMSAGEIGILLAAGMTVRAFATPFIAQIGSRGGRPDRALAALAWAALASYALFALADGFWMLLGVTVLATMFFTALIPMSDALTMQKVNEGALVYGKVRLWGSITFIAASTLGGLIVTGRPAAVILWLVLGALLLCVAAAHMAPRTETEGGASARRAVPELLRDPVFVGFALCASLLQASHAVYYGFATLHWQAAGHSETVIGALFAEGVIAEIILFALSGPVVARLGPAVLLAIAAAGGVLRWVVLGLTTDIAALVAVQGLHAATFGAAQLASVHFIARHVPAAWGPAAQSLYSSTAVGLAMGMSTLAAGALYAAVAGQAFLVMAGMSLVGGAGALVLTRAAATQSRT
jgi:PPP family 3-phenylpropionic acid transporter